MAVVDRARSQRREKTASFRCEPSWCHGMTGKMPVWGWQRHAAVGYGKAGELAAMGPGRTGRITAEVYRRGAEGV